MERTRFPPTLFVPWFQPVGTLLTHGKGGIPSLTQDGERWGGGFDLPFLRTRLCHHEIDWPFTELPDIDAMDVFESRFNTSEDTLTGVYDELIGNGLTELDPFSGSEEAVDAWEQGDFEPLVLHNVADIRRTRALMQLAERYCSKSHFTMRSLDPIA